MVGFPNIMDRRNYDAGPYDTTGRIFNVLTVNTALAFSVLAATNPVISQRRQCD